MILVYGKGISKEGNILDIAVNLDIIEKSGSWFSYKGERVGQGRENVKKYLIDNPEVCEEIEKKIRDNFNTAFEKSLGEEELDRRTRSRARRIEEKNLMYSIEEFDELKTKVLKYIMFKKRTELEIKRKFANIENQDLLEDVIEELKEIGYINDESYIQKAVNEYIKLNNLSLKELKYKLMAKGINGDLIDDYIYSHSEELEQYEIDSAKNILLKKQNNLEEEKLIQYLLKKGYKLESIKMAIEEEKL